MSKRRRGRRHEHNHLVPHQGEPTELAARLTPLEETHESNNGGAIVVDTSAVHLPKDFTEREEKTGRLFGLEPIALVIFVFALAFIAFITYLISVEPARPEDRPATTVETGR